MRIGRLCSAAATSRRRDHPSSRLSARRWPAGCGDRWRSSRAFAGRAVVRPSATHPQGHHVIDLDGVERNRHARVGVVEGAGQDDAPVRSWLHGDTGQVPAKYIVAGVAPVVAARHVHIVGPRRPEGVAAVSGFRGAPLDRQGFQLGQCPVQVHARLVLGAGCSIHPPDNAGGDDNNNHRNGDEASERFRYDEHSTKPTGFISAARRRRRDQRSRRHRARIPRHRHHLT